MKYFWSFVIAVLLSSTDASGQQRFEAPVFLDGDFWQYRVVEHGEYMKTERELNGVYEIEYLNGQFKAFKLEMNQKNELRSGAGVLTGLMGQSALQHLQFPLFMGKSWTTDYTFRPRRREVDRSVRAVTKVTDFAEVTISAGSFKAFKLEREARFKNVDHWIFVYHWSPQTKSVVKYEMNVLKGDAAGNKREIELIRFGSAPNDTFR
jgi:hypothetical protein